MPKTCVKKEKVFIILLAFCYFFSFFSTDILAKTITIPSKEGNFEVIAPDFFEEFAKEIASAAEGLRKDLAVSWFGAELSKFEQPIKIYYQNIKERSCFYDPQKREIRLTYSFYEDRFLKDMLVHEMNHAVFYHFFNTDAIAIPPWIDEGAAGNVESEGMLMEKRKALTHEPITLSDGSITVGILHQVDNPGKEKTSWPLRELFSFDFAGFHEDKKSENNKYLESFSVVEYMIRIGGTHRFAQFTQDVLLGMNYDIAIAKNYKGIFSGVDDLQNKWLAWAKAGFPEITPPDFLPAIMIDDNPNICRLIRFNMLFRFGMATIWFNASCDLFPKGGSVTAWGEGITNAPNPPKIYPLYQEVKKYKAIVLYFYDDSLRGQELKTALDDLKKEYSPEKARFEGLDLQENPPLARDLKIGSPIIVFFRSTGYFFGPDDKWIAEGFTTKERVREVIAKINDSK